MDFSEAGRKERALEIFEALVREYPEARPHLNYSSPYQLLVATILAAQCTDEAVNKVTPELFRRYPGSAQLASADQSSLEQLIRSTGFYRNKTKSLLNMARALEERHAGRLPESVEEMVKLPGVGRKTANVVAGNCHGTPAIIVDTHFKRLAGRLGLSGETDPDKIELSVREILPERHWTRFSLVINEHGRQVCTARKPRCPQCVVNPLCPFPEKNC
jgi:endonuclease-3